MIKTPQEQWITEWMGVGHHRSSELLNGWVVDTVQINPTKTPQVQWITDWVDVRHHRGSELLNGWLVGTVQDDWDTTGAVNYSMDGCKTPQKQWITEWMGVRHHRSSELLNGWVWDTKEWSRHHRSSELLNGCVVGTVQDWDTMSLLYMTQSATNITCKALCLRFNWKWHYCVQNNG